MLCALLLDSENNFVKDRRRREVHAQNLTCRTIFNYNSYLSSDDRLGNTPTGKLVTVAALSQANTPAAL